MLILSRREAQSIKVDGPCEITAHEIFSGKVKLAFKGPSTTNIVRTELLDKQPVIDMRKVAENG